MIFDLHCDTLSALYEKKKAGEPFSIIESELSIDEKKLVLGNYTAQCFAAWVTKNHAEPYRVCREMIDIFHSELKKSEILAPAYRYDDILRNGREGKISAILSLEDATPIGDDIGRLSEFYQLGVRMIGLVWNYPNSVGYPNFDKSKPQNKLSRLTPNRKDGLSDFGYELVSEMNRLGIVIDVSHLSDAGFYDVSRISNKPFVASHSNSRSVCSHVRNLTDGMLRIIAECGGIVGINYYSEFLDNDAERGEKTVERCIEHISHIGELIGYDYIALGSDFDGIPRGAQIDSAKDMPLLVEGLFKSGFRDSEIEKITRENALRVFKENMQ